MIITKVMGRLPRVYVEVLVKLLIVTYCNILDENPLPLTYFKGVSNINVHPSSKRRSLIQLKPSRISGIGKPDEGQNTRGKNKERPCKTSLEHSDERRRGMLTPGIDSDVSFGL